MRRVVILFISFLFACGSGDKAGTQPIPTGDSAPAGGDSDVGGDQDVCEPGQLRDGNGNCVTICAENSDCDEGDVCNVPLGMCVPGPSDDTCDPVNCASGFECPPTGVGDCVAIEGWCANDDGCGFGERCDNHECVSRVDEVIMTCESDQDCWDQGALLLTCQAGVCVGCVDDLQCGLTGGGRCVLGACVVADLGPAGECLDANCPEGERCSLVTGQCQTICATDEDCLEDESCLPVANLCVAEYGCDVSEDCKVVGMECVAGLCVGCTSDAECLASETCLVVGGLGAGACFPRLDATACDTVTCPEGDVCDPADGSCYPEDGTCVDDSDCRSEQTCNFLHLCSGCSVDGDCRPAQRCLLSTCVQL